jgi:hypothetical protein
MCVSKAIELCCMSAMKPDKTRRPAFHLRKASGAHIVPSRFEPILTLVLLDQWFSMPVFQTVAP